MNSPDLYALFADSVRAGISGSHPSGQAEFHRLGAPRFDPGRDYGESYQAEEDEALGWSMLFFAGLCGFVVGFVVACLSLIVGAWTLGAFA